MWRNKLDVVVKHNENIIKDFLLREICSLDHRIMVRGIGMIWGIDFGKIDASLALKCVHKAFDMQLILEVAGRSDAVLKIMPPLTIEEDVLMNGLNILKAVIVEILNV